MVSDFLLDEYVRLCREMRAHPEKWQFASTDERQPMPLPEWLVAQAGVAHKEDDDSDE